jgi:hypothetical protein
VPMQPSAVVARQPSGWRCHRPSIGLLAHALSPSGPRSIPRLGDMSDHAAVQSTTLNVGDRTRDDYGPSLGGSDPRALMPILPARPTQARLPREP